MAINLDYALCHFYCVQQPALQCSPTRTPTSAQVIIFERAGLVFAFNFHWDKSFTDYRIACEAPGKYQPVLSSDDAEFGGASRNVILFFFRDRHE
jgi:1,4-alpha-glucan branching enzyme